MIRLHSDEKTILYGDIFDFLIHLETKWMQGNEWKYEMWEHVAWIVWKDNERVPESVLLNGLDLTSK